MDTPTAVATIQSLIKQKQSEMDALILALSILQQTFAPDLTAITMAQQGEDEQHAQVVELTAEVEELEQELNKP